MTGTCEWATYPRLLERDFFLWTKKLYELEQDVGTPILDSMHWTRRFEYPWVLDKVHADAKNPYSHTAPEQNSPKKILDVGAGATALQFLITKQNKWSVTAVDPDQAATAWIEKTKDYSIFQTNKSMSGGFPILPFKNDEFDTGICISVLEHLPKDQVLPSIRELLRVSRKEVLITMDVVLGTRHPTQMDQSDFNQHMQTLKVEIPEPSHRITFQMDGYLFGVACLHLTR